MGQAARDIFSLYQRRIKNFVPFSQRCEELLERLQTFSPARPVQVGNIRVTPLWVDHSAYDAYMFLIEAEGKKVLHTGDYRLHGFRGKGMLPTLKKYVGQVDLLITEGTTLSRPEEKAMTERQVSIQAEKEMRNYKYVFVLCSSTNIDRLAGMAAAARRVGKPFVCDMYQKSLLDVATQYGGPYSSLYDFSHVVPDTRQRRDALRESGFVMPIRAGGGYYRFLRSFPRQETLLIYSMWPGYIEREDSINQFFWGTNFICLHTSGHADAQSIRAVCRAVRPKLGVIPIHTEAPDRFDAVCEPYPILHLYDGEQYTL